jgi:hypothetical protein
MTEPNFGKTLVTLAVVGLLAAGTGCGNDQNNGGNFDEANPPNFVTDSDTLAFVSVSLDQTDTQTVTILNVGEGDLKLSNIKLVEETREDPGGEEFRKGENWTNSAVLATNEELRLQVEYTPTDRSPDNGYIEVTTNDPKFQDTDGVTTIPLETPELAPRIFSKENVIFRRVPPVDEETRNKFWQITEVQNIGQAPLELSDIIVSPEDSDFSISFPDSNEDEDPSDDAGDFPGTLEPGESFPIRVYFNPVNDLPSDAELIFFSNDPDAAEYVVNLLGNSGSPCLQLNHEDEVNFGEGGIGFANNKTIIIENCSPSSDLNVSSIDVCTFVSDDECTSDEPTFEIKDGSLPEGLPDSEAVIGPQDTSSFVLTYTPEDLSVSTGELTVVSNDPAKSNLVVPVVGKGTDNACPQAVAEAKLSDSTRWQTELNTIPLKTIDFRATNSVDADGTIERYEWNIVQRPTNSTARMQPNSNVAEPSLFLDLAGDYVIELKVFDDKGTESCGDQALITIRATPDEDIHVQLVWDTPTDQDQTDTNGTDVDLHFLHPNGTWNNLPFDIFWNNPTNEWGAPGADDNPSLDIDDTDGAGPENINLTDPESGLTYAVGAYYYAANGFGPSYATVRIFIRGQQKFEWRDMYLPSRGSFWYVATISWPSTNIFAVNNVQQGFPNRP